MDIPIEEDNSAETIVRLVAATVGFGGQRLEDLIANLHEELLFDADLLIHLDSHQWSKLSAPMGLVAALRKSFQEEVEEKQQEENNIKRALRRDSQARLERRRRGRQMSSSSVRHIVMEVEEDEDENSDHLAAVSDYNNDAGDELDNVENILVDGRAPPPPASCFNPPLRLARRLKPSRMLSRTGLEYEYAPPDQKDNKSSDEADDDDDDEEEAMPMLELPPSNNAIARVRYYLRHVRLEDWIGLPTINRREWKDLIVKNKSAWEVKQYVLNVTELCFLLLTLFVGVFLGLWEVFPDIPESGTLPESFYVVAALFQITSALGAAFAVGGLVIYSVNYIVATAIGLNHFKKCYTYLTDAWFVADHLLIAAIQTFVLNLILCLHGNLVVTFDKSNGILDFDPSYLTVGLVALFSWIYVWVNYNGNVLAAIVLHGVFILPWKGGGEKGYQVAVSKPLIDISNAGETVDTTGRRRSSFSVMAC